MIFFLKMLNKKSRGFTIIEIVIYIAILVLVLLLANSVIFYLNKANSITKADREALENARRALDMMSYEIKGAKSVYTTTTSSTQLSLETYLSADLPTDETISFVDFFLCGTRICVKKESQNSVFITSDTVEVSALNFTQINTLRAAAIKIDLTVNYKNPLNLPQFNSSVNLTSTISLRSH